METETNLITNDPKQSTKLENISIFSLYRFCESKDRILIALGVICSGLLGAAFPLFSYFLGDSIDAFRHSDQAIDKTRSLLFNQFEIGVGALFIGWGMHSFLMVSAERQARRCRSEYLKALMKQEVGWFETQKETEIAVEFMRHVFAFQLAIGEKISNFIMNFFFFIIGSTLAIIRGWELALVLLGFCPFMAWSWNLLYRVHAEQEQFIDSINVEANSKANETILAIRTIKQLNSEQFEAQVYANKLDLVRERQISYIVKLSWIHVFSTMCFLGMFALGYWYGAECVKGSALCPAKNRYTGGDIIGIFFCIFVPAMNIQQLAPSFKKISEGRVAAASIFRVLDRKPLIESPPDAIVPESFGGVFRFERVTFAYPKDKSRPVLRNLTLELGCANIGIMGTSGSGKSTLFQLMMRFYDPDEGRVTLDGRDIRLLDLNWLRRQIGYVSQEPVLFSATIREILLLAKPEATEVEMKDALSKAEILEFVEGLKDKLDTYVGNVGGQLSGGQKQRIAIARALLKAPRMLLFDQATSALDRRNEKLIQETIRRLSAGRVVLTIAHRLKTIIDCDQIVVMGDGELLEKGRFAELERFKGLQQQAGETAGENELQVNEAENIQVDDSLAAIKGEQLSPPKQIDGYAEQHKIKVFFGILFSIGHGMALPAIGIRMARIVAFCLYYNQNPDYYNQKIAYQCIFAACIAVGGGISNKLEHRLFLSIGADVTNKLQNQIYQKIIKMPIKWFDLEENSPFKVANSLSSNGRIAKQFFNTYISYIFAALSSVIFGVTIGLVLDWRTGLVALGLLPILGVVSALQTFISLGKIQTSDQVYKQSTETISQCISNLKTILSYCAENEILDRYSKILSQIENQQIKNSIITGIVFGLSYTILYVIYGILFHVASIFIKQYGVAAEDSFAVIFVINFAAIIGGQNIKQIPDLVKIKIALRDIFKVLDSCDEDQLQIEEKSALINRPIVGNIEFREVSFKYQSRQETVLSDVSFSVKSGEFAALVGPSGCGKSTILSLLLRFYEPTSGQIIVDGVDLRDFDVHCLRHYFGTVGQEPTLFDETVLFNIAYSKGTLTEEEMRLALRILNLACEDNGDGKEEEFLQRKAGPRGSHLSGGQKQRVAIARTAVRFPSLLLLDEATSALDKENARIAEEALRGVMEKKTVINVSHKLESLRDFDKIFVLKKGSIVESGTHEQLLQQKDNYYKLYNGLENL